ncbi:hypothetical protein GCM10010211_66060 [Streptomyces albospinus]|uniref:Uncharacterized protein n=1 Tax=Streptomyces albospinus TaxID=285515 RepID=A0ABQ2VMP1_9ACTN|nr:hypothetical protein GCM10010211_66060 [Streptomyces albospinus]
MEPGGGSQEGRHPYGRGRPLRVRVRTDGEPLRPQQYVDRPTPGAFLGVAPGRSCVPPLLAGPAGPAAGHGGEQEQQPPGEEQAEHGGGAVPPGFSLWTRMPYLRSKVRIISP